MLITFSGNHGSGKSTHAGLTLKFFKSSRANVKLIHIVDLSFLELVKRAFGNKTDRFGSNKDSDESKSRSMDNEKPMEYSGWIYSAVRMLLYKIDLAFFYVFLIFNRNKTIVCDRYLYDKVANFDLSKPFFRIYAKLYLFFVPKPDIAFYLDAENVYERKKEYRMEFYIEREESYKWLISRKVFSAVKSEGIEKTQKCIERIIFLSGLLKP